MNESVRVVKVGGSLLELADLDTRLRDWLTHQLAAKSIMIVGGGPAVAVVREHDRRESLADAEAHWQAIEAMSANARGLASRMQEVTRIERLADIERTDGPIILDVIVDLHADAASDLPKLPLSWDVTSDSIAAWVAGQVDAAELVLLKSSLPRNTNIADAVADNYVDRFFVRATSGLLSVRCVNLRDDPFTEKVLLDMPGN
jgi:aspartokinase-like uncharacterized kinase